MMTAQEIEVLLRLLAECERQELELIMQEWQEADDWDSCTGQIAVTEEVIRWRHDPHPVPLWDYRRKQTDSIVINFVYYLRIIRDQ